MGSLLILALLFPNLGYFPGLRVKVKIEVQNKIKDNLPRKRLKNYFFHFS